MSELEDLRAEVARLRRDLGLAAQHAAAADAECERRIAAHQVAEAARKIAEAALMAKPNPLAVDQLNLAWGCLQQIVDTFKLQTPFEIAFACRSTIEQMKELNAPCPAEPQ